MTIGASNASLATRSAVSWNVERGPTSAMNCLGMVSRDSGHTRVPAPPHMITGWIFFGIVKGLLDRRLHGIQVSRKSAATRQQNHTASSILRLSINRRWPSGIGVGLPLERST